MSRLQSIRDQGFDKSVRLGTKSLYVGCSQCEALVVNGIPTHERGCPNAKRSESNLEEEE